MKLPVTDFFFPVLVLDCLCWNCTNR